MRFRTVLILVARDARARCAYRRQSAMPRLGPGRGRRTACPAPALPCRQLVEPGHPFGAGRSRVGGLHRVHQQRRYATPAPRLRRRSIAGQRRHLRDAVRDRRRHPAEAGGHFRLLGRKRRRELRDRPGSAVLSAARTGHHAGALGRGRCAGERRSAQCGGSPPARHRLHEPHALRALQRLLQRDAGQVVRRFGRVLRHEDEQPPPRHVDIGRCRGPRHLSRARPLRRRLESGGDRYRPRVPRDRACHERLRVPGFASRRIDSRRVADGRAAAPEDQRRRPRPRAAHQPTRTRRGSSARCRSTASSWPTTDPTCTSPAPSTRAGTTTS